MMLNYFTTYVSGSKLARVCFHTVLTLGFIEFMEPWIKSHINYGCIIIHFVGTKAELNIANKKLEWIKGKVLIIFVNIEDEISSLDERSPGSKILLQSTQGIGRKICENYSVNSGHKSKSDLELSVIWKQLISVEIRYRSLIKIAYEKCAEMGCKFLIHSDSDMMLVGNINNIVNSSKCKDIGLVIKDNYETSNQFRKILGCLLVLRVADKSKRYLQELETAIDRQNFLCQPKGFGQKALFEAWQSLPEEDKLFVYKINNSMISFRDVNRPAIYFAGNIGDKRYAKLSMLTAFNLIETKRIPRKVISLLIRGFRVLYVSIMVPIALFRKIQNACR